MTRVFLALNFMHCMERFATQIYRTQKDSFKGSPLSEKLAEASANEQTHVDKLNHRIRELKGHVYPLGWLFQLMGIVLGLITRIFGKGTIFKADTFVERRAVKDYTGFIRSVKFDQDTVTLIRGIIVDEKIHIINWQKVASDLNKKS